MPVATKYPELFSALAAPFDSQEVRTRTQANRQLSYITARTAMNRLDNALGPENWWDDYTPGENSVICRLTIRLPDGSTITKADAGGYAGMADEGDDDKSGYSDAFKRACVKFGPGRYLYRDGVPSFIDPIPVATPARAADAAPQFATSRPAPAPARATPPSTGDYPADFVPDGSIRKPDSGKGLFACTREQETKHEVSLLKPINEWGKKSELPGRMVDWDKAAVADAHRYLCYLVQKHTGTLPAPGAASAATQSATANGGGDIKRSIIAKVTELLTTITPGPAPSRPAIKAKIDEVHAALFDGEVPGEFKTYSDSARLQELDSTLTMMIDEAKADSDIPF